jgi:hypothetical protein
VPTEDLILVTKHSACGTGTRDARVPDQVPAHCALSSEVPARLEAENLVLRQQGVCGEFDLTRRPESETSPAVAMPAIRFESRARKCGCATPLRRGLPAQSGVTAVIIVKRLVVLELPFEVAPLLLQRGDEWANANPKVSRS